MDHHRTVTQRANDFRIWRSGSSVDWDCNATEIANDLGLSSETVRTTCARRGWKLKDGRYGGNPNRMAADTLINSQYIAGRHE